VRDLPRRRGGTRSSHAAAHGPLFLVPRARTAVAARAMQPVPSSQRSAKVVTAHVLAARRSFLAPARRPFDVRAESVPDVSHAERLPGVPRRDPRSHRRGAHAGADREHVLSSWRLHDATRPRSQRRSDALRDVPHTRDVRLVSRRARSEREPLDVTQSSSAGLGRQRRARTERARRRSAPRYLVVRGLSRSGSGHQLHPLSQRGGVWWQSTSQRLAERAQQERPDVQVLSWLG
jgi:hypothetical protein